MSSWHLVAEEGEFQQTDRKLVDLGGRLRKLKNVDLKMKLDVFRTTYFEDAKDVLFLDKDFDFIMKKT